MNNNIYVFIDAANLWEVQKLRGMVFDYRRLKEFIKNKFQGSSIRIFYYTAYPKNGTRDYSLDNRHKFFTFLEKGLGFVVRKKPLKRVSILTNQGQHIQEKGNLDVELAIDAVHYSKEYDTAVLCTGDSDFLALIRYLRRRGKKVYIFASKNSISWELRAESNGYCDLLAIRENIWREKPIS